MSYRRAIKSRKEEISIFKKKLRQVKKDNNKKQAKDLKERIELVKKDIKKLENEMKGGE